MSFEFFHLSKRWRPLGRLYEDERKVIVGFHDGVDQLRAFAKTFDFGKPVVVLFTCSWNVSPKKAYLYADLVREALAGENRARLTPEQILFVANSDAEFASLRSIFPISMIVRGNHAATLDESAFVIAGAPKRHAAVFNARPSPFKRHFLTRDVPDKAFISFRPKQMLTAEDNVNLAEFAPSEIYWSATTEQVAEILDASRVGLMLSAIEGACWASLEYLLCGLPVVSTHSKGGRSDFYDLGAARIVEDNEEQVALGVRGALEDLDAGRLDPREIRKQTLAKLAKIRSGLERDVGRACERLGFGDLPDGWMFGHTPKSAKMWDHINYWPTGFRVAPES
jgi:hypothetical protein